MHVPIYQDQCTTEGDFQSEEYWQQSQDCTSI